MTARTEIEHRHLYYKRRSSCSHGIYKSEPQKTRSATSATTEGGTSADREEEMIRSRPPRVKSTSVCVGSLQLEGERRLTSQSPRTLNDFQFLNPETLTMQNYELQTIRPPAISTSEIFNEPPPVYIYRVIPPHERNITSKKPPNKVLEYLKGHKHTLIAWTFGIFAVTLCTVVVVLQCKSNFK
ncbi:uncharacterized protein CELE_C50H2.13 [Caenorhabditis elegans]|uniref:Uncharacterized protein n=1 Tax=Caenorhabditis elegans TaxID=6239 RepID=G5ED91_CAEEL|nr:Uncharacterized protein CELE_C50H2.13 [Caenorhabditis elegans]CAE17752.1 Uncharacterized protein CELE_C50H2.13 [Caenorhabditis elegans]|eukprot:NP_001023727.1 Uncharacterized protein CELE_C50H2.13 [Caenorhabditis elegans]